MATQMLDTETEKSVAFYALGCRTNQLESSLLADEFKSHGWNIKPFSDVASLYIINSCTVTHKADADSRYWIRKAKRQNPNARVAVTGCYAQVASDDVAAVDGVNYVIGNNFKQDIYHIIESMEPKDEPIIKVSDFDLSRILEGSSQLGVGRTRAALKVQDGCNYRCTYCIIPFARGPNRCPSVKNLVQQLQSSLDAGHQEIVLTGIDIGQYSDPETGQGFDDLVETLLNVEGQFRLRISSIDPNDVSDRLIDLMATSNKLCPYFHLSCQSLSDTILKRMGRRHRVNDIERLLNRIHAKIPKAAIGSDFIVGFPGETKELFDETYQTVQKLPFSYFHTFSYSPRKGTAAVDFPDHVAEHEKKERARLMIELSQEKQSQYYQSFLEETVTVLVEASKTKGLSQHYVPVALDESQLIPNTLVNVTIQSANSKGLQGRLIQL